MHTDLYKTKHYRGVLLESEFKETQTQNDYHHVIQQRFEFQPTIQIHSYVNQVLIT